jgi:diguanylate cyclase (GGDEF)-like protein/PAS domain S-box-containing protein
LAGVLLVLNQVAVWNEGNLLSRRLEDNVAELERASLELRMLLDSLAEAVVVVDRSGLIVDANARLAALYGVDRSVLVGQRVEQLVPVESRDRLMEQWSLLLGGQVALERPRFEMTRHDGSSRVIEVDARPLAEQGDHVVLSLRNITDRAMAEAALRTAEQRFRLAFEAAPTGTALIDSSTGRLVDANENLARMLRVDRSQLVGVTVAELTHPDDLPETERSLRRVRVGEADGYHLRKRYLRSDGSVMWGSTSVARLDTAGDSSLLICHVIDITDEVAAAERLAWSATHDEVTGLANRTHFLDVLRRELLSRERPPVAVLFLDLDRFKIVNDSLGHAAGDDLLRIMAGRLRDSVRPGDLVARFGGDEFTVMLRNADLTTAMTVARRVMKGLSSPVELSEAQVDVTASVGVAVADSSRVASADELVRDADAAMYRAKEQGRDRVVAFTPEARMETVHALLGRNELRLAIERNEIVPYFQPIIDLASGRLVGYESVARWRHPERGLLMPDSFLPTAEERGLIGALGAQVLRSSLSQLARWIEAGTHPSRVSVSVNVSARQLIDARFVDVVADALAESGVEAELLWLELTETALMTDVRSASSSLRELRDLGLHLAVDDFGTGYSSLTYLKRFPVEAIKIDRAFVAGLGIDPDDSAIVEAVVRLGSSLGLLVVAEGVESPLQLARLRDLGCDRAQGYLFGRPRPAELVDAANHGP